MRTNPCDIFTLVASKPETLGLYRRHIVPEKISAECVHQEVASGRFIISANINHPEAEAMIIGCHFFLSELI
ncbi:MAG: hypothetical protein ACR5K4_01420 [Sodalis sp. (in: enterobacteria)]